MLNQKLEKVVFAITDTETTGREQGVDEAIEIASVKWTLEEGFLEMPKSWLVKPTRQIHPSAMAVHHLTEDDIKDAPSLSEVQPEVEDYVKDCVLVAHNSAFDMSMLPFLNKNIWVDSLRVARHTWKKGELNSNGHDLTSHTCQELRYWLGLKVDTMGLAAHRAAADILVAGEVFAEAVKLYIKNYDSDYNNFYKFATSHQKIETMPFGKYAGQNLTEIPNDYFKWFVNDNYEKNKKIDPDLLYNIDLLLKSRGIDYLDLIKSTEKTTDWKAIAQRKSEIKKRIG